MSNRNNILLLSVALLCLAVVGCKRSDDNALLWGSTNSYDDFLWVRHTPDTLTQTLCFDFNADAQQYMNRPLKLALCKKNEQGQLQRITPDEAELFVDGTAAKNNIIEVGSHTQETEIGIVLNRQVADITHYWYFTVADDADLDRINNEATASITTLAPVQAIRIEKRHVMNPLAKWLMWIGIVLAALIALWFLLLKPMFYPTIRVNSITFRDPAPLLMTFRIKGYRRVVLSNQKQKQGFLNRLFTGKVLYKTNAAFVANVLLEPKGNRRIRLTTDPRIFMCSSHQLQSGNSYTLTNLVNHTKTTIQL